MPSLLEGPKACCRDAEAGKMANGRSFKLERRRSEKEKKISYVLKGEIHVDFCGGRFQCLRLGLWLGLGSGEEDELGLVK